MKKSILMAMVVVMVFALTACGNKEKTYDLSQLSQSILEKVTFEDTLTEIDSEMLSVIYGIDETTMTEKILYKGSGATAEEFILLKMTTEEEAKKAYANLEQYVADQKEAFASYVPAEVNRLESSYLVQNGQYVFLCVASDTEPFKALVE